MLIKFAVHETGQIVEQKFPNPTVQAGRRGWQKIQDGI